jgi:stage V sporulation protein AC
LKVSKKQYNKIVEQNTKNSPVFKNTLLAFIIGGGICVVGQFILNVFKSYGFATDAAAAGTSILMIFLGALFTGLGLYDKLAKYGGAGTLVPITGFANAIVSPAMEFKSEGFVLGMSAKMFAIAGPVLVFGIVSSVVYGLILYLFRLA